MIENKEEKVCKFTILFLIFIAIITFTIKSYNNYYENISINEIKNNTVIVNKNKIDESNNGKLVLLRGKFNERNNELADELFNISVNSVKLYRHVEVYQWIEIKEKDKNGKTIYRYEKVWSDKIIKSKKFKNSKKVNPNKMEYKSIFFTQDKITIGKYELSKLQKKNITCNAKLKLGNYYHIPESYTIYDNYFTNSINPEKPQIGDYRISYYYNDWEDITILAKQKNNSFDDYITKKKENINFIGDGTPTLVEIINVLPLIK